MGMFKEAFAAGLEAASPTAGAMLRSSKSYVKDEANQIITQHLIEKYMNQENMLPVEAKEKADGVYSVALSRVEQRGEDPYGEMGDKMLNGQQDYCRALREVEGVHVAEIKAWWDGPGVLREIWVMEFHEEFATVMEALRANAQLDSSRNVALAWKTCAVFDSLWPDPNRDPDYTALPAELILRYRARYGDQCSPPWLSELYREGCDPDVAVAGIAEEPPVPTVNGWMRATIRAGRMAPVLDG